MPVCVSNIQDKIKLNRWNNGYVIIEMLDPIDTKNYTRNKVKELSKYCYNLMDITIKNLNKEVEKLEKNK